MTEPNKCSKCGGRLNAGSKYGVCTRNPACKREWYRQAWAAGRPEREQRAAEKALAYAAERAESAERILELRKQGLTRLQIRTELHLGAGFVAKVTKGIPGRVCRLCGGPRYGGGAVGICTRNPDCVRARAAFTVRFRLAKEGLPSDLTVSYLVSIWTGRCSRQDCGKVLAARGGPRNDVASLDRIIPAKGYMQGNVRWLCGRCNRQKQDMTSAEMMAMLADQLRAEGQLSGYPLLAALPDRVWGRNRGSGVDGLDPAEGH